MQVTLDREQDGGVVLLNDRLYHFNPSQIPRDGEVAIVVTAFGELRAGPVGEVNAKRREAWLPFDGPGQEGRGRDKVAIVGTVTRSFATREGEGFPITAETARGIVKEVSAGPQLRERILTAVRKAAEDGHTKAEVRVRWVPVADFDALQSEMNAVGFIVVRSHDTIVINWSPRESSHVV